MKAPQILSQAADTIERGQNGGGVIAKNIKPQKKGFSDFYSWQLYSWLKKNPHYNRIYSGVWNSFDGYNPQKRVLYIGLMRDNCFLGAQLTRLCTYGSKLESWAFCRKRHHLDEWIDVTDAFWSDYHRDGVCAIHGDLAHKWDFGDECGRRVCRYCRKVEIRKLAFVPKIIWEAK